MYKRFCHIPMEMDAPTDTAMMKITKKNGEEIIRELNDNFILELRKSKVIKGRKIRIPVMRLRGKLSTYHVIFLPFPAQPPDNKLD